MTKEDKATQSRFVRAYDARGYVSAEGSFFNRREREIVTQVLQPGPGMRILDLPAGTGRLTLPLAASKADVVAMDIIQNMLDKARAKTEAAGEDNVEYPKEEATALLFPDNHFGAREGIIEHYFFEEIIYNDSGRNIQRVF